MRLGTPPCLLVIVIAPTLPPLAACGDEGATTDGTDTSVTTTTDVAVTEAIDNAEVVDTAGQVCPPGKLFCVSPSEAGQCNADGSGIASTTPCIGATACEPATGLCRATICAPNTTGCLDLERYQVCAFDGSGWGDPQACAEGLFCAEGKCRACTESEVECLSETTYRRCAEDASAWSSELLCPSDYRCVGEPGDEAACKRCGFERVCIDDAKVRVRCTSGELAYQEDILCPLGQTCQQGFCRACAPDQSECLSETSFRQCADDGSAWSAETPCPEGEACFEDKCLPYGCSPRVLFLVDYSGSMGPHWEAVAASVASIVSANPEVRFGLKSFPDADSSFSCDVGKDLEIDFAKDQGATFATWFATHDPPGATPLAAGMGMVFEEAETLFGSLGGFVIVLSDGFDSCYGSANPAIRDYLALTAAALYEKKVETYGIAYAFGDQEAGEMDTIAKNGGTGESEAIDAGNEDELTAALEDIIDRVKFCDILEPPTR
ncbi:MAG: VWA domain-containing protein [Deltaproteobacteria bacterium]|nr:VWA domain-containing protein [Deltaproteobacteria bacterium]